MSVLKVVGLDPSLRNWGIAVGQYNTVSGLIAVDWLEVIQPEPPTGKQTRQNSKDLHCAKELYLGAYSACIGANAVFVEVPVGSQSSRAMASYGVCVGVLGGLRASGIPFFEVTPTEVKMASVGSKTATKNEMIEWAVNNQPKANWPIQVKKGESSVVASKAEHMADAVAAIHAGTRTNEFKQFIAMLSTALNKSTA